MGYEGFLFTPFQVEKEQAEAFVRATRMEAEKDKAKAEAGEEGASLKAKAEKEVALIVNAGCGSKRKAEEDLEEASAAIDVMVEFNGADDSEDEFYKACMADDSIDYDSDEGPDARYAKCKAWFESRMEACNARHPWLVGKTQEQGGEC